LETKGTDNGAVLRRFRYQSEGGWEIEEKSVLKKLMKEDGRKKKGEKRKKKKQKVCGGGGVSGVSQRKGEEGRRKILIWKGAKLDYSLCRTGGGGGFCVWWGVVWFGTDQEQKKIGTV